MTLREEMTSELRHYGWLDRDFTQVAGEANANNMPMYVEHLNTLSDSDFLYRYKTVKRIADSLD